MYMNEDVFKKWQAEIKTELLCTQIMFACHTFRQGVGLNIELYPEHFAVQIRAITATFSGVPRLNSASHLQSLALKYTEETF